MNRNWIRSTRVQEQASLQAQQQQKAFVENLVGSLYIPVQKIVVTLNLHFLVKPTHFCCNIMYLIDPV